MDEQKKIYFCCDCGERVYRHGYMINDKFYCNRCMQKNFRLEIEDKGIKDEKES